MDQEQKPPVLEGPIELLSSALSLYWQKRNILLPIGLIVFSISVIQSVSFKFGIHGIGILTIIAGVLVAYVAYIAMIKAISLPTVKTVKEIFTDIEELIVPAAWVSGLVVLAVLGGAVLLFVPGVIAAVALSFSLFAFMIDGKQKTEALVFSWELVMGRWWKVLGRLIVANIVIGLIVSLITAVAWSLGIGENPVETFRRIRGGDRGTSLEQSLLSQAINNFFSLPVTLSFMYVFYEALKRSMTRQLSEEETAQTQKYIRTLSIVAIVVLVGSIFVSGFFIVRLLPQFVEVTHSPASVFMSL